jgi:uncharacterized membrane protein
VAVVLGIASAVSIVWFIDHITRRIRIDDTMLRITERTVAAFRGQRNAVPEAEGWNLLPDTKSSCVRARTSGFVQAIDLDALVGALPAGTVARLDTWIGHFVTEGNRLLTLWAGDQIEAPDRLRQAVAIGATRTIEQDPGLGIRQLVDIALRALSPGVNDPATAADASRQLSVCIRAAYLAGDIERVFVAENGARLVTPRAPTVGYFVTVAFEPVLRAAAEQPLVLRAVIESLRALADELADLDQNHSHISAIADKAAEALEDLTDC